MTLTILACCNIQFHWSTDWSTSYKGFSLSEKIWFYSSCPRLILVKFLRIIDAITVISTEDLLQFLCSTYQLKKRNKFNTNEWEVETFQTGHDCRIIKIRKNSIFLNYNGNLFSHLNGLKIPGLLSHPQAIPVNNHLLIWTLIVLTFTQILMTLILLQPYNQHKPIN